MTLEACISLQNTTPPPTPSCGQHLTWGNTYLMLIHLLMLFRCSIVADSLCPHGLQHARLPCPPPSPGACSNSYPLSWLMDISIQPSLPLSSPSPPAFSLSQRQGLSNELALRIRWSVLEIQLQHQKCDLQILSPIL